MTRIAAFLLTLLIAAPAAAQRGLSVSPVDPFIITEFVTGSPPVIVPGNSDTGGLSVIPAPIDSSITNIVLILGGQSLGSNTSGALYTPTNNTKINNVNIYDGASYQIGGNLLGCSNSTIGPGNVGAYLADAIISAHPTYRVWLVPIAIGGTSIADWSTGNLKDRAGQAMRRLKSRGITPSTPNTYFIFQWMHGETDAGLGTSSAAYQAGFASVVSNLTSNGFSGRIFVNLETYNAGVTSATIRSAQTALVNGTTIFQGFDMDTIGAGGRGADNEHLNPTGAGTGSTGMWNQIKLTGAPY